MSAQPKELGTAKTFQRMIAGLGAFGIVSIGWMMLGLKKLHGVTLPTEPFEQLLSANLMTVNAVAIFLGFYHYLSFHPANQKEYRNWLQLMPWQPGKPLPLGSLRPPREHLVILAGLVGLAWFLSPIEIPWLKVLINLPAAYLAGRSGAKACAYSAAQMPLPTLLTNGVLLTAFFGMAVPWLSPVLIAILQVPQILWDRTMWSRFPWKDEREEDPRRESANHLKVIWPYNALSPRRPEPMPSLTLRLGLAALLVWCGVMWAMLSQWIPSREGQDQAALAWTPVFMILVMILASYCTWRGTQGFHEWIPDLPAARNADLWAYFSGYREFFLSAAMMLVVAATVVPFAPQTIALPIFVAAFAGPLLLGGRDLNEWRLTAPADLFSWQAKEIEEL